MTSNNQQQKHLNKRFKLQTKTPTFIIKQNKTNDHYSVWQLDLNDPSLVKHIKTDDKARFPRTSRLSATGGYVLSYSQPCKTSKNKDLDINYRVFEFDPNQPDPLNSGKTVRNGAWDKNKFWGWYDYTWTKDESANLLQLLPTTGFILQYMPASTRSTYRLWNFDPAPTIPYISGTEPIEISQPDPLPEPISPLSAFSVIGENSQLLPIGNYVLEWMPLNSEYRVWSFDPQEMTPLQLPAIAEGQWPEIDNSHELLVVGDYILDWQPETHEYTLWHFDPLASDPLVAPIKSGTLPKSFDKTCQLTSLQTSIPVNTQAAKIPGTMDFMRDKIEHVVVYMVESRTMDNVLGWLYEKDSEDINYIHAKPPFRGTDRDYSNTANGQTYHVKKFRDGALSEKYDLTSPTFDPFHDTTDSIHQMYGDGYKAYLSGVDPDMSGFVKNNAKPEVMDTLTPEQLPVLNGLAKSFAVCDDWFSALPGGTDSNRAFALTGSCYNITTTYEGNPQYENFPDRAHRQSLWKVLWNNGIDDWKIYYSVLWEKYVFSYQLYLKGEIPTVDANVSANKKDYVAPIEQFMDDANKGHLPKFSFLEPAWIAPKGATSYHPGGDIVPAEVELNKIYKAISDGPGWDKTALLITFSKGGGLYDHVSPPAATNPWPKDENDGFHYDVLGPRVPAIVVSPWVNKHTVFRSPGDNAFSATSMTATVLDWFGIPKSRWGLGDRVQSAETFESVFERDKPRTDIPEFVNPYDKTYPKKPIAE